MSDLVLIKMLKILFRSEKNFLSFFASAELVMILIFFS